jgi:hypothetical protein
MTDIPLTPPKPSKEKVSRLKIPPPPQAKHTTPFFTNPPSREKEFRCNPNLERSFLGSLRKYRNMQPEKKRSSTNRKRRMRKNQRANATRNEREREFCFVFCFFGPSLNTHLP